MCDPYNLCRNYGIKNKGKVEDDKVDGRLAVLGFRAAELVWDCETRMELSHLCSALDSLIPKRYEHLTIVEELHPNRDRCQMK